MKKLFLLLFLLSVFTLSVSGEEEKKKNNSGSESTGKVWFGEPHYAMFELGAGFFYHTYSFETKDGDAGEAAHIKYRKDLGYEKAYLHFTGDFIFRFKKFKLSLNYTMLNTESTKTIGREIVFYDADFQLGNTVKSTFDVHLLTFDFTWYIMNLDAGKNFNIKLGPSIRIDTFITGIKLDDTESDKGDKFTIPLIPFPSLGISFETTIYKYSGIFFDINGMYAGKYLGYMNLKTGIRVYPWHWTGIEFAYRHIYAEALFRGDSVKTDFHGFNMSFLLRF